MVLAKTGRGKISITSSHGQSYVTKAENKAWSVGWAFDPVEFS